MWDYGTPEPRPPVMVKNKGLAIFFGLIPGAGQMYLGKMLRGLTLMLLFFGVIGLTFLTRMSFVLFILPVIWFYAFFDNLNLASLTPERLAAVPDELFFGLFSEVRLKRMALFRRRNTILGWGCVTVGALMILNLLVESLLNGLTQMMGYANVEWLWSLYSSTPQLLAGALIIFVGVCLVKGPKRPGLDDDFIPYRGEPPASRKDEENGSV